VIVITGRGAPVREGLIVKVNKFAQTVRPGWTGRRGFRIELSSTTVRSARLRLPGSLAIVVSMLSCNELSTHIIKNHCVQVLGQYKSSALDNRSVRNHVHENMVRGPTMSAIVTKSRLEMPALSDRYQILWPWSGGISVIIT